LYPDSLEGAQEWARQWLAFGLLGVLAAEVFFALVVMVAASLFCTKVPTDFLKEVMVIVFGPTVALVGSATGFYFGSKPK
jgi:Na+/citrate or Na+/malate symporter